VPTSIPVKITEHDHKEFSDSGVAIDDEIREIRQNFNVALVNTSMTDQYNKEHAKLLRAEDENAWDRAVRNSLDPYEEKAAVIIGAIREFERNVIFGNLASEAIPGENTRDMGGQYLTNKKRIDHGSLLYQIAVKVPKGGLLHLHFNAELHPERLLVQARDIEDMYIWSMRPLLNYKDLDETEVVLNVLDSGKVEKGVDLFSEAYPSATNWKKGPMAFKVWMPWSKFQEEFKKHFPHKEAQTPQAPGSSGSTCCTEPAESGSEVELTPAERWLESKMVLSEEEAYLSTQTVNG
jgi:adenosine deaminase CECR1